MLETSPLAVGSTCHGFSIESEENLPEIAGTAYIGTHTESGARLLYLQNDDSNKSFAIGFRTPPQDDTGVFHILEHSVLCGSRRFPVKEPFVDLLKGSMQTFLNAMTFADKTLYPVASTNEQDLYNLMDVYLDAVFHPRIYEKRQIFEQEGWHYEFEDDELTYNGVVYNEMKGALSDASSVLYDEIQKALFPDTCYAFESGGTPAAIPTLTYENYLDEHRRHYRTDNSYIILYGDLDIDRALAFIDERYLSPVSEEQRESDEARIAEGQQPLRPRPITIQAPVKTPHFSRTMDTAAENACSACGYVIGDASERMKATAAEILLDALFGSNEAPLKRALLDAGVAHDIQAFVSDALAQPFAMIQLQMPSDNGAAELASILERETRKLVEDGFDLNLIEAALSHAEFVMREHNMGLADGVAYAMVSLSSWLYDDDAAIDYLRYEQLFSTLRTRLAEGYFEKLAIELFCENNHTASVEIIPAPGTPDDDTAEKLAHLGSELTSEQKKEIEENVALLRELQEKPDSPEDISTLPRLSIADIGDAPAQPRYDLDWKTPLTCIRHSVETHGIAYAYRYFDLDRIDFDDLPYVSILGLVLGKLDTTRHSAAEIDTLVQGKLGNLGFYHRSFERKHDAQTVIPKFVVSASALSDNAPYLATLVNEILFETDFSDSAKILDVLKQRKISLEQYFSSSGHSCATAVVNSYCTQAGVINNKLGNVGFYRFLCDLIDNFEERSADLAEKLGEVVHGLFCDNLCTVSFAGPDAAYDAFWLAKPQSGLRNESEQCLAIPEPKVLNEAFIVPSDVCYTALGWDHRLIGSEFDGSWLVAARALSFDYLWNEVRVKGGAYGAGFSAMRSGTMRFYSYRDPHLDETFERFAQTSAWLAAFDPSQEDLDGFIVATVAGLDAPIKPRDLIRRQAGEFFTFRTPEERLEMRRQTLSSTRDSVRALASEIDKIIDRNAFCVFGNREIIEGSKRDMKIVTLIG